MMSDLLNRFSLYVFAHEVGHMVFGWPDLYYFGDYCLMGNRPDDANPPAVNDLYRADQGWIPVVDLGTVSSGRHSAPHGAVGFRWANPARPDELFLAISGFPNTSI
jgi:M6 family metalloprotease-like protein